MQLTSRMLTGGNVWRLVGVVPLAARLRPAFVQHEARADGLSVFSGCYHLRAQDWYSCEVQIALELVGFDVDSEAFDLRDCDDHPRTFHGTTFKSLMIILQAGGLRADRTYKGVFQSAYLGGGFSTS